MLVFRGGKHAEIPFIRFFFHGKGCEVQPVTGSFFFAGDCFRVVLNGIHHYQSTGSKHHFYRKFIFQKFFIFRGYVSFQGGIVFFPCLFGFYRGSPLLRVELFSVFPTT